MIPGATPIRSPGVICPGTRVQDAAAGGKVGCLRPSTAYFATTIRAAVNALNASSVMPLPAARHDGDRPGST
jgi:hypothetical protein